MCHSNTEFRCCIPTGITVVSRVMCHIDESPTATLMFSRLNVSWC